MKLISKSGIDVKGKNAVVIGRSKIVVMCFISFCRVSV